MEKYYSKEGKNYENFQEARRCINGGCYRGLGCGGNGCQCWRGQYCGYCNYYFKW